MKGGVTHCIVDKEPAHESGTSRRLHERIRRSAVSSRRGRRHCNGELQRGKRKRHDAI